MAVKENMEVTTRKDEADVKETIVVQLTGKPMKSLSKIVMYKGSNITATPKSARARPRRRKFAVECKAGERKMLTIINRFPTAAEAEMKQFKTALMSRATSVLRNIRKGISFAQETLDVAIFPGVKYAALR